MAGAVGGTLLLLLLLSWDSAVGVLGVLGDPAVVTTEMMVGVWPAVLAMVVGGGLDRGDSVVAGVRPSSEGVEGEGLRTKKGVAAGRAVVRRRVVSGEPVDGITVPVLRIVVRGGPVRGACAVGVAALGKGWLA